MITSHRHIGLEVRIFTNTLPELDTVISNLRQQYMQVTEHYKKELEEIEGNEIQIHVVSPQTCPKCHLSWSNCQCGKPNKSPLV